MANLSDLLNPAPFDDSSSTGRNDSLPIVQIPANPYRSPPLLQEHGTYTSGQDQYAAHALSSLSNSTAVPPPEWHNQSASTLGAQDSGAHGIYDVQGHSDPPYTADQQAADEQHRRGSRSTLDQYHHTSHSPEAIMRKMSSPTLEHYHMSSRSPEHIRRTSVLDNPDPNFKLAPLQNTSIEAPPRHGSLPTQAVNVSQSGPDTNAQQNFNLTSISQATTSADSHVNDNTHSEIAKAADISQTAKSAPHIPSLTFPTDSRSQSTHHSDIAKPIDATITASLVKTESHGASSELIPAFVPVSQVEREQPTTSSPIREVSVPITTTEDIAGGAARGVKRPAPKGMAKKGTAKRAGPPAKKQKTTASDVRSKAKPKSASRKPLSTSATPHESPAPRSARDTSTPAHDFSGDDEQVDDDMEDTPDPDDDLYCLCRKPDTGTFMIGCDGKCDDWYHGKCVNITEKDKNLIDRYICPRCEKNGVGVTTWKRMCRREGCRMPARLGKDAEPSKYCSDKCGIDFFRNQLGRTRGAAEAVHGNTRKTQQKTSPEHDRGPRGGVVNRGELKALVTSVSTLAGFKRLGDGVLSPPATPSPWAERHKPNDSTLFQLSDTDRARLAAIDHIKAELRARHALFKDQGKLIAILRAHKSKNTCGYDDRVRMDEVEFSAWRTSAEGEKILSSNKLPSDEDVDMGVDANNDAPRRAVQCLNKKCPKHHEWAKLAAETNRSETAINSQRMREIEAEEEDVRKRAEIRTRLVRAGDVGGSVEFHGEAQVSGLMLAVDGNLEKSDGEAAQGPVGAIAGETMDVDGGSGSAGLASLEHTGDDDGDLGIVDGSGGHNRVEHEGSGKVSADPVRETVAPDDGPMDLGIPA